MIRSNSQPATVPKAVAAAMAELASDEALQTRLLSLSLAAHQ